MGTQASGVGLVALPSFTYRSCAPFATVLASLDCARRPAGPAESSPLDLPTSLLDHPHDGPDRGLRLIGFDVVAALIREHLLAVG